MNDSSFEPAGEPTAEVLRDGVRYTLLGTAHVSRASVAAVRSAIESGTFDAIAVELCAARLRALCDRDAWRSLDLWQVIREGKAGMVAANLVLSAYQRRLAEQFGIEPGAEMKLAAELAERRGMPLWLIDRDVDVTLKRAYRSVSWFDRLAIISGLVASLFERGEIDEAEIENLKHGDLLQSAFHQFAEQAKPLFHSLITERDRYMAARLRQAASCSRARQVLVVVGAGHLAGIARELGTQREEPTAILQELSTLPPASRIPSWIGLTMLLVIAVAIAVSFGRGASFGTVALRDWILFTGGGAALGAALAGAHPGSVLVALLGGPLKPFRPLVPVGALSAGTELWLHRPRVADFEALRDDVLDWRGWWRNRIARTLLVFLLTDLGMIVGEFLAGLRILQRLL
jgi:pheromone shutdown-related protein TraB